MLIFGISELLLECVFCFKQKTAYDMRISDWSSDVCSSDLSTQRTHAQSQLSILDTYRADYTQRLQQTTEDGVSASNYHNFRRFIATLDEAISQQNRVVAQIDARIQAGQQQWYAEKRRTRPFETLKARQDHNLRHPEKRRDQPAREEPRRT